MKAVVNHLKMGVEDAVKQVVSGGEVVSLQGVIARQI